ncbi:MAG: hypothetical protein ACFFAO_03695 [Candidatus Hermodarchaeota archaeon]
MEKIIDDLWIITNDGLVIFTSSEHTFDDNLFGAFLTAINIFVKEISNDMLRMFEISDKRYILVKERNLMFVASSYIGINEDLIKEKMNLIIERFLKLYPRDFFEKWNHDTNKFLNFEIEMDNINQNRIEKLLKAI